MGFYEIINNNKPDICEYYIDEDDSMLMLKKSTFERIIKEQLALHGVSLVDLMRHSNRSSTDKKLKPAIAKLEKMDENLKKMRSIRFEKKNVKLLSYGYSKNWEENNIVYKYIEEYGFKNPFHILDEILSEDEKKLINK